MGGTGPRTYGLAGLSRTGHLDETVDLGFATADNPDVSVDVADLDPPHMLAPGELKRGLIIDIDGAPCIVEGIVVQTPSSRGAATLWKVRARDLKLKRKVDKVYKAGDAIAVPNFEKRPVQFLYRDASGYHFMDLSDYDQFTLAPESIEEESPYLIDNMEGISSLVLDEQVIGIELPPTVDLKVVECAPALRGSSATGRTKPATLETGLVVQVPEHLASGVTIRVETGTGRFIQRVGQG